MRNHKESNFLSNILFSWVNKLVRKGHNKLIQQNCDLYKLPSELIASNVYKNLSSSIKKTSKSVPSADNRINFVLWKCLTKSFLLIAILIAIPKIIANLLGFIGPLILTEIVTFLEESSDKRNSINIIEGFIMCLILFFASLFDCLFANYYTFHASNLMLRLKTCTICIIYQKLLTLPFDTFTTSSGQFSRGQVINLISIDAGRISNFYLSAVALITLPIQFGVTLYLLYLQLGLSFLMGLLLTLIILPINKLICDAIGKLNRKMLRWKDSRIKLISEVLSGIKMVKMQSWEKIVEKRIEKTRWEEINYLKKIKYLDALCVYFWASTPVLISLSTFTVYILTGNTLTASKTFTSLALFNKLLGPINALPWVFNGIIEAIVSLRRVQKFLDLQELNSNNQYTNFIDGDKSGHQLQLKEAVFSRYLSQRETDNQTVLGPINFNLKSGNYVALVGKVGSGKSSFFSAIIGEIKRKEGSFAIKKSLIENGIGYLPQEPWIFNSTIKENILFGKCFDQAKYSAVIQCCALDEDLRILPDKDETLVGDQGIALSGGQKARIALARAIYQEFQLYLLDDPYASVDIHVAKHLKLYCIDGLLRGKSKIIATHHTELVKNAKELISLEGGTIQDANFQTEMINFDNMTELDLNEPSKEKQKVVKQSKIVTIKEEPEEERERGKVKLHVYNYYIQSIGSKLTFCILLSFCLMQLSRTSADWWLSYWTTSKKVLDSSSSKFYIQVFAAIAVINSVFTLIRAFLFAYGTINASIDIHKTLIRATLSSSLSFFSTNTYGRIINRFASDISEVDDKLPANLNLFITHAFQLIASLVVTIYGIPASAVVILFLGIPYYFIQKYYRSTAREVKRLSSVTFSPIYTQLSETLAGLSVIRAFSAVTRYVSDFHAKLDSSNRCQYTFFALSQWLNLRLQILAILYSTGVALTAVLLHCYAKMKLNAGLVGLSLVYSFTITDLLNGLVQTFAQLEIDMVAVERIKQYLRRTDKEKQTGLQTAPNSWPKDGRIVIDSLSFRYKPDAPRALDNVNLVIQPYQHVAIVGRTGSGKSTLVQCLLRLNNLEKGRILLDGVDINDVSLQKLRSSIFIVPQDSYLFSGTIRYNLDPLGKYTDDKLWNALKQCQGDNLVHRLGGLNGEVTENGQNISLGERQLLCLSRALLSKCKVICFDEITSSIDKKTNQLLEVAIKNAFHGITVITIAHKVDTIINYDRVLVMDRGHVVEDGNPQDLKANSKSRFGQLWRSMESES